MRHKKHGFKLGITPSHRRSLLKNMAISLIKSGSIKTTVVKAKFVKPYVERLITEGKINNMASIRHLNSKLNNSIAVKKLIADISVKYTDRPGGYLRIIRVGSRKGDNAEMAILQMV